MLTPNELRALLILDIAIRKGAAEPRLAAEAFGRWWDQRGHDTASFEEVLRSTFQLDEPTVAALRASVERAQAEGGGDVARALSRHEGLRRVADLLPDAGGPPLRQALAELEAALAERLPPMRELRYGEFEKLDKGGMGVVYAALDMDMSRQVAFKVLHQQGDSDNDPPPTPLEMRTPEAGSDAREAFRELSARLILEARVTGGMEHPGILPVYEVGRTPYGVPYYTMRLVKSRRTLEKAIEEVRGRPFEERIALLEPFLKLCDTVRYAHSQGVLHRDIKPRNVALGDFGEVVLLDWGLARLTNVTVDSALDRWHKRLAELRTSHAITTLVALGTPLYMAPEIALERFSEVDHQSDVYSLGSVLYEILTGKQPYTYRSWHDYLATLEHQDPQPPSHVALDVPPALSNICLKSLARLKESRTASVRELVDGLRGWQAATALDREVEGLLRDTRAAVQAAEDAEGDQRLRQLQRADGSLAQVDASRPTLPEVAELRDRVSGLREKGVAEREKGLRLVEQQRHRSRLRLLVGSGLIVVAVVFWVKQAQTEQARVAAIAARDEARSLALAALSAEALQRSPDRALLLARAAVRVKPTYEATTALHDALAQARESLQLPHDDDVKSAAFAPGGTLILTTSKGLAHVWDRSGQHIATIGSKDAIVTSACFSPDGQRILTTLKGRTARLWDLHGGTLAVLNGHDAAIGSARFSPDGTHIVTASADRTARVWDWLGTELAVLRGHGSPLSDAVFSPDGSRILTASGDQTAEATNDARMWDLKGGLLAVFHGHEGAVRTVEMSPDGATVLTSAEDNTARLWDLSGRELVVLRGDDRGWGMVGAEFSPDGAMVLTGTACKLVRLWDRKGTERASFPQFMQWWPSISLRAHFIDGGRRVLTGGGWTPTVWDLAGKRVAALVGHRGDVRSVAQSPKGDLYLTSSADSTARLWKSTTSEVGLLSGHEGLVEDALFSPDGLRILTIGADRTMRLWDLGGKELAVLRAPHREAPSPRDLGVHATLGATLAEFSPDGRCVLTEGMFGMGVWDLAGDGLTTLSVPGVLVTKPSFSPDGSYIIAGAPHEGEAYVWDRTGQLVRRLSLNLLGRGTGVYETAFSPDGKRILAGDSTGALRQWNSDGRELATWQEFGPIFSACFSPDGSRILTSSSGGRARLWDLQGRPLVQYGGKERIYKAAFSPDGSTITTSSNAIDLWDLSGRRLATLQGAKPTFSRDGLRILTTVGGGTLWDLHGRRLSTVRLPDVETYGSRFSPDGKLIVTACGDGTARLWLASTSELLQLANTRASREFSPEERVQYAELLEPSGP